MQHIAEVKATINAIGRGSVEIDGIDVSSKITGMQIATEMNEPTRVMLFAQSGVDIELDGIVEVVHPDYVDVGAWLDGIDPDLLEELAIETHLPTGQGFIAALKELWDGR